MKYAFQYFFFIWIICISCQRLTEQSSQTAQQNPNNEQDDLKKYIEGLNEQIQKNPKSAHAYYERAMAFYRSQDTAHAWRDIQQAVVLDSTNAEYIHFRGFCQYVWQQNDYGLADFQKAAQLGSSNPETYYQIGNVFILQNKLEESLTWYDLAMKWDSLDANYPFAKGLAYDKLNRLSQAKQYYERSLALDSVFSKTIGAYFELKLYKEGDFQYSLDLNSRLLRQSPNHPLGRYNVGNYYLWEAMRIPNDKPHEKETFIRLGIDEFEVAILADTSFTKAFYQRGYAFFMLQEYNQALIDFRRAGQLDAKDERACFMQASIYEHFQDYEQALVLYERALSLKPSWLDAKQAIQEVKKRLHR